VGTIGILFQNAADLILLGDISVIGSTLNGPTNLAGVVFDSCPRVRCDMLFAFEHLAVGMTAAWCDDGAFGSIQSNLMKGLQPFGGNASAGSSLAVIGCRNCSFGRINARSNYKPVLYCSVGFDRRGRAIDNQNCSFGQINATAFPGSPESSLIALRSGRGCRFAGATGHGFACGYHVIRYLSDEKFNADGNNFGPLIGDFPSTRSSVDAAIVQEAEDPALPVGVNHVDRVMASCGGEFGVAVFSGVMSIGSIKVTGGRLPIVVANASLSARSIQIRKQGGEAITLGGAARLTAGVIEIASGSMGGQGSAIRYNPVFGSSAELVFKADAIRYRLNGRGVPLQYIIYDPEHTPDRWHVGLIDGAPLIADGRFRSGIRANFRNGRITAVDPGAQVEDENDELFRP
jgi:hypothetical protein